MCNVSIGNSGSGKTFKSCSVEHSWLIFLLLFKDLFAHVFIGRAANSASENANF